MRAAIAKQGKGKGPSCFTGHRFRLLHVGGHARLEPVENGEIQMQRRGRHGVHSDVGGGIPLALMAALLVPVDVLQNT